MGQIPTAAETFLLLAVLAHVRSAFEVFFTVKALYKLLTYLLTLCLRYKLRFKYVYHPVCRMPSTVCW